MSKSEQSSPDNKIKLKSGMEVKVGVINLDLRCEINDKLSGLGAEKPNLRLRVWLLRKTTKLSDNDINEMGIEEITELSIRIFEKINKKKVTK